jgi:hypothetical protein
LKHQRKKKLPTTLKAFGEKFAEFIHLEIFFGLFIAAIEVQNLLNHKVDFI